MPLEFSANLSTMFQEVDLIDRFERAKQAGFKAFELQNPYILSPHIIKEKMGDMKCDLLNFHGGPSGFGCASLPLSDEDFNFGLEYVKHYSNALNFRKLHILSGNRSASFTEDDQFIALVQRLKSLVAGNNMLETYCIVGLIEPICMEVNSHYFLNSFDMAVEIIKQVGSDDVKLLLDIFHLHKITRDVKKYLEIYFPYCAHVQISQDPGRKEPFCSDGKIDYRFVLDFLRQNNHRMNEQLRFIGLEYFPSGPTESTLGWMKDYTE